ncbi:transcription elongation factor [Nonlabens ponticola]|uniref:Transcription elongation factor n=1 Tax=Nonlabens ponticola TaxID=2496866 RepID=A0A3S9MY29_9FLAO|nr:transcription elongation factor [Nonlabens ponticola]AZQ44176.1 transcription elongation factor [Nonlabens ponticola]
MKDLKKIAVAALKKEIQERTAVYKEKMENINETLESGDVKHGYDNDDSHGELLGDLERYAQLREEHEDMLIKWGNIDFHGGKQDVQQGAIVRTENNVFLVSIPMGELTMMEGHDKVYAISTEAPLYKAMDGLKEGDEFKFNDKEYKIKEIY